MSVAYLFVMNLLIYCFLKITSRDKDIDFNVEEKLKIKPTLSYKMGETYYSKRGLPRTRSHHLWLLMSEIKLCKKEFNMGYSKEERVKHTLINKMKKDLNKKKKILQKYKEDTRFNTEFWICMHEEQGTSRNYDKLTTLNLRPSEIEFITKIANKVHFSIFPYQDFKKKKDDPDFGAIFENFFENVKKKSVRGKNA